MRRFGAAVRHRRTGPGAAVLALGRLKPGAMNKSEEAYAAHLEAQKAAGVILWWKFEALKLRLADNTFYTPDFAVLLPDGTFIFKEVKGFMTDDANVKIKVAAETFPFQFFIVRKRAVKDGGGFSEDEV